MTVAPIIGEIGRYHVTSEENMAHRYICDILSNECGCASWVCNHRKHKEQTGKNFLCKHLKIARAYCLEDYLEIMREHALSK